MKNLLKAVARALLGEYSAYYVLRQTREDSPAPLLPQVDGYRIVQVDHATIAASVDPVMRDQAGYAGEESLAYACMDGDRIAGLCFYWYGARYQKRNFWPLESGDAKLVQIITSPSMRGKKVAGTLIAASCSDMMNRGFNRLFARVWHSNHPSLRAFASAGWIQCATVIEIDPMRRGRPSRLRFLR